MSCTTASLLQAAWVCDPLIRRGLQHDGRDAVNPAKPGVMPQKVPHSSC